MGVVFLDPDDEITTAITRLRASQDIKVALVLPPGSRIGTSRINFRLLAREAQELPRQVAIVTGEQGVRAIAVSAGLPAYASVAEYEATVAAGAAGIATSTVPSQPSPGGAAGVAGAAVVASGMAAGIEPSATPRADTPAPPATSPATGSAPPAAQPDAEAAQPAAPTTEPAEPAVGPAAPPPGRRGRRAAAAAAAATAADVGPLEAPEDAAAGEADGAAQADTVVGLPPVTDASTGAAAAVVAASTAAAPAAPIDEPPLVSQPLGGEIAAVPPPPRGPGPRSSGALPVVGGPVRARGGLGSRGALVGIVAVVGLLLLVGLALAVFVLPGADITVAAPLETIGPVTRTMTADPDAIEPDLATGVIPAEVVSIPLAAEGEYESTGIKITETKARGSVTFSNLDPGGTKTIPAGSVVATDSNIRFRTLGTIRVPRAKIKGFTIEPGRATVRVEAVKGGESGNVPANAIQNIPSGMDPVLLKVTNGSETTGGARTESSRVSQEDVDRAVAELTRQLEAQMAAALEDPATVPAGSTLIPETAEMGAVKATPALEKLVGKSGQTFKLALSAAGSVIAVDTAALEPLAAELLSTAVPAGVTLFPETVRAEVGSPSVVDGAVTFEIGATGQGWRPLDEAALLDAVRGLSVAEAQAVLGENGEATIDVWPFYVATIPDGASLTVVAPTPDTSP